MPLFYYFQNVAIYWSKICRFSTLIRHSHIKTWQYIRAFSWDVECKSWFQKPSLLLSYGHWFRHITNVRRMDGRTVYLRRPAVVRYILMVGTHWQQCRHSGDKSRPLSTKSTELNMLNFGDNVDKLATTRRQSQNLNFVDVSTMSPASLSPTLGTATKLLGCIIKRLTLL